MSVNQRKHRVGLAEWSEKSFILDRLIPQGDLKIRMSMFKLVLSCSREALQLGFDKGAVL